MGEHKPCKSCAGGDNDKVASPAPDRRIVVPGSLGGESGARGSFVQASLTSRLITRANVATLPAFDGAYRNGVLLPKGDAGGLFAGGGSGRKTDSFATIDRRDPVVPMFPDPGSTMEVTSPGVNVRPYVATPSSSVNQVGVSVSGKNVEVRRPTEFRGYWNRDHTRTTSVYWRGLEFAAGAFRPVAASFQNDTCFADAKLEMLRRSGFGPQIDRYKDKVDDFIKNSRLSNPDIGQDNHSGHDKQLTFAMSLQHHLGTEPFPIKSSKEQSVVDMLLGESAFSADGTCHCCSRAASLQNRMQAIQSNWSVASGDKTTGIMLKVRLMPPVSGVEVHWLLLVDVACAPILGLFDYCCQLRLMCWDKASGDKITIDIPFCCNEEPVDNEGALLGRLSGLSVPNGTDSRGTDSQPSGGDTWYGFGGNVNVEGVITEGV